MVYLNEHTINVGEFPNGETYYDVDKRWIETKKNIIRVKFQSNEDITTLMFIKDFVDTYAARNTPCHLVIPYMPYSRMDRQEEKRLFTLKTLCKFINSMNFDSIQIWEPHSDACVNMLDRVEVVNKSAELAYQTMMDDLGLSGSAWLSKSETNHEYGFGIRNLHKKAEEAGIYFVYPDAGAEKRYSKQITYPHFITATKRRDFNTGRITSISLNTPMVSEDATPFNTAIIVDDLCSKGGTFAGAAVELKKLGFKYIVLVVTHCEYTIFDGDLPKSGIIDKIVTTESILSRYFEDMGYNHGQLEFDIR